MIYLDWPRLNDQVTESSVVCEYNIYLANLWPLVLPLEETAREFSILQHLQNHFASFS